MANMPYSMDQVLDLVGAERKGRGNGVWIDVVCPINRKHEIRVNREAGSCSCFHECSNCPHRPEPGHGGITDLYCLFSGIDSRSEAHKQIMTSLFGSNYVQPRIVKNDTPRTTISLDADPSDDESLAPIEVRDKAYRKLLSLCGLTKTHRKDLHDRGFTDDDIKRIGYCSIPQSGLDQITRNIARAGIPLANVPGFIETPTGFKMQPNKSGIFIPYFDALGRIQGLQIRYDIKITSDMSKEEVKQAKQKRYRWFTSGYAKNGKGTNSKNYAYFGDFHEFAKPETGKFAVYVTEGGLKAQTASVLCERVYHKKRPFVAIPGVSCYQTFRALCKKLRESGVTTLVDTFDSDRATNESVMGAITKLKGIAKSYGLEFIHWDFGCKYKGIDDFLLAKEKASKGIVA